MDGLRGASGSDFSAFAPLADGTGLPSIAAEAIVSSMPDAAPLTVTPAFSSREMISVGGRS